MHARILRPKRKLKKHGASTINEGRKSSDRCAGITSTGDVYTASQVAAENLNAGGKSNDRCPGTTTVNEGRKSSDRCAGITPTENVYTVPQAVLENLNSEGKSSDRCPGTVMSESKDKDTLVSPSASENLTKEDAELGKRIFVDLNFRL